MKTFLILAALVIATVQAHPHPEYAVVQNDAGHLTLENLNQDAAAVPENFFTAVADTRFLLHTNGNPVETIVLDNAGSLESSNFNSANPTRFLIHGWGGDANSDINVRVRNAYLQRGSLNVIVVDWSVGASTTLYQTARNRVSAVGATVSLFINFLHRVAGARHADVNVIGHNLGAHIAGLAGKHFYDGQSLGAVVGLDASLNLFSINEPTQRIANTDALYVETIHTNTGQNGFDQPLGMSSFYPNFGNRQPGCGLDISGSCSHGRAIELFAESITTSRHFWSRQCSAYKDILMEQCTAIGVDRKMGGEPIDTLARGIYWLSTNSNSPFATGVV